MRKKRRKKRKGHVSEETGLTHDPAPIVRGHVAVHLDALARVSVNVNGVNAAQSLAVQKVLGAVLRRGKQTAPWKEAAAPLASGYVLSLASGSSSECVARARSRSPVAQPFCCISVRKKSSFPASKMRRRANV